MYLILKNQIHTVNILQLNSQGSVDHVVFVVAFSVWLTNVRKSKDYGDASYDLWYKWFMHGSLLHRVLPEGEEGLKHTNRIRKKNSHKLFNVTHMQKIALHLKYSKSKINWAQPHLIKNTQKRFCSIKCLNIV